MTTHEKIMKRLGAFPLEAAYDWARLLFEASATEAPVRDWKVLKKRPRKFHMEPFRKN
jgi:hypothetical protein